ncbi:DUF2460 domain-containing protein, partial [Patescibacteria group bacterium]|nr:DUF2460 domain-containing protein [Patescibacteria group bacterium]
DGQNYKIKDLYIDRDSNYQGLFGYGNNINIYNVYLIDIYIYGSNGDYLGGLIGYVEGSSNIYNCNIFGDISGDNYIGGIIGYSNININIYNNRSKVYIPALSNNIGGLVGYNNGKIYNCYSESKIWGINGGDNVGGLIGYSSSDAILYNNYSNSDALGDNNIGGLIGKNNGELSNCYCYGGVTAYVDYLGGLIGYNDSSANVNKCYSYAYISSFGITNIGGLIGYNDGYVSDDSFWDKDVSFQTTSDGGTGKTTEQLKIESTFINSGWDFENIWDIKNGINNGYPFLIDVGFLKIYNWEELTLINDTSSENSFLYPTDGNYRLMNNLDNNTEGYNDYASNISNVITKTNTDIDSGDGETKVFQIRITYPVFYIKEIDYVEVGGIEETDYEVDYTDGIITFGTAPSLGDDIILDFKYYAGWIPIGGYDNSGTDLTSFTGSFDGQGYEIKDLFINRTNFSDVGLFGRGQDVVYFYNVNIKNCIIYGKNDVGGIIGEVYGVNIKKCLVDGYINLYANTGGLLIGYSIENNNCTIEDCISRGIIENYGTRSIGGIIGECQEGSNIINCYSNCSIINLDTSTDYIGGIVGYLRSNEDEESYVYHCCFNGEIKTEEIDDYIGGIVGFSENFLIVENSYSIANIIVKNSSSNIGGIIGHLGSNCSINNCHFRGDIIKDNNSDVIDNVGGIIGSSGYDGSINDCYVRGNINGGAYTGGIIGDCDRINIYNSFFEGNIYIYTNHDYIGGIVGYAYSSTGNNIIENCFFNGSINIDYDGASFTDIGGVVGYSGGYNIYNCYAIGNIIMINGDFSQVGGLMGDSNSSSEIQKCYSSVNFKFLSSGTFDNIGGLIGDHGGSPISNSFWNSDLYDGSYEGTNSDGGTGKTITQLKTESTFTNAGWDFVGESDNGTDDIWNIISEINNGYPFLMFTLVKNEMFSKKEGMFNDFPIYIKKNGDFIQVSNRVKINNQFN